MSTWPNMPVGATVLFDHDMSSKTGLLDVYNSWIPTTDASEPVSPNTCFKSRLAALNREGGGEVHVAFPTIYREMFVGLSWRTNAAFQGRSGGNKTFFMRGPDSIGVFVIQGGLASGTGPLVWSHNSGALDNSHTASADLGLLAYPNVTSGLVSRGTWTRIEAYIKASTTNTSRDGIIRWWINGTLVGNYTNFNYAGAGLNEWIWTETWDGCGGNPGCDLGTVNTADWEHYIGHLFIAAGGTSGGGGGGGTPSTPVLSSLTPATITLAPGNAQVLTATMSAAVTASTTVALASSNSSVATAGASTVISPGNASVNFNVTAGSAGSATITATVGSTSKTSVVTVAASGGTSTSTTYTYASQFSGVQGQNQWSYRDTGGNLLTYNAGGSKWEGDELYLAIWNSGFVHGYTGSGKGAVLRWTAPANGTAYITGTAALYENPAGGTFAVQYNSTNIFGAQAMSVSTSYPYALTQDVSAGDTIDFIMGRTQGSTNNNTQLDPVIVFTPTTTGSGSVTVSSMTPSHGNIGSSVTIVGTGFSATAVNNTITVNGTPATITSSSTTQLIFTVPASATTGLVNVATSAGSVSAGTYTVDNPTTPDTPPASNFGGSAMLLLVMP